MGGTTGQLYLAMMKNPTQRDTGCVSLIGVDPNASDLTKSCRRMGSAEISSAWQSGTPAISPATQTTAGSLGPYALTGDFYVEITDPATGAAMWGIDTKLGLCFQQFTLTAVGITKPDQNLLGVTLAPTALYGAEGLEMSRARVTSGPMRQGCN